MRKLKLREINPLQRQMGLSCKGVVKIVKIKYFWCAAARANASRAGGASGSGGGAGGWNHELVTSTQAKE